MSIYTPHQAGSEAYSDTCVQNLVDSSFNKIRGEIKERAKILDKSLRITIGAWIRKLSEETRNEIWKKNRNQYAKLLLAQLKCGRCLDGPFNALPPSAPLPTLNKALLYPYTKPKNSNSISRPLHTMHMSPSQQLDSYLSHHEDLAPPTAENLKFSFKTPTSRIASRIALAAMPNEGYLNTATSHVYPQQQHQQPFTTDHSTSSSNADNEAPDILELRLAEAEERLRQHSNLLSLFLDISSADDQLKQLELREEEENQTVRARRQQPNVSQVLERAENPMLYKDSKTSISSGSARSNFSRNEERLFSIPRATTTSPPEKNKNKITEEVLLQKLAQFDAKTASLKAKLEVTKPLLVSSSFFSFNTGHSIDKKEKDRGLDVASSSSLEKKEHLSEFPRQKSNSVTFIPARHTLKSAAAAVATRKLIENDLENNQDCQKSFDHRGGGGASMESKNLHKAAALLKPRPGSTTALISEVAALRKRVANSLACIEESSLSSSHVDGADLSNTMPLSSFSPEVSLFNLSNSVLD